MRYKGTKNKFNPKITKMTLKYKFLQTIQILLILLRKSIIFLSKIKVYVDLQLLVARHLAARKISGNIFSNFHVIGNICRCTAYYWISFFIVLVKSINEQHENSRICWHTA